MIEAYFFDLDGTLVDTEILWVEALEALAGEHEYPLPADQALEMVYGLAWPEVYQRFKATYPNIPWDVDEMGALLAQHFLRLRDSRDICIESSIALLRKLATTHPVAVVSGSYREDVAAAIGIAKIDPFIRFYLGHEDYHPGKPHPACYLSAADMMGVPAEACVVFEDSTAGLCAAKDAGMFGVAIARPGRPEQDYSRADLVLEDLADYDPELLPVAP